MPRICDYEGSHYRTDFWENQGRAYEDGVERVALYKLLPPTGDRLIEIGAGFGRLADLYAGYQQVVLLDYARTQLQEARRYLGDDPRFLYVVGDVYNLPFVDNLFDTLTMVRVMHHLTDVPTAATELHRIIRPQGTAIVEHASKLNLKAILRWLVGQQQWNPFQPAPIEFVDLNFNFHPAWVRRQFEAAGLPVQNTRTVSHYRVNWLKRTVPTRVLVALDRWAQPTGNWWQLTPSVFVQATARGTYRKPPAGFFRCPACYATTLHQTPTHLTCQRCGQPYPRVDGIYDFKL